MRNCRNRKVNRGAILCSRKQGSAAAGNTIEKANRDDTRRVSSRHMQTAVKSGNSLSPPLMRSTMHTQPRAGILPLCRAQ